MPATVLHVSESDAWSGGAAQLLALARGLEGRGWKTWIACRPRSGLMGHARERGLAVYEVGLREDYDLLSAWRLARFIRAEKISVVHAHHNRSHAVCLLAKLLLTLTGGPRPALVVSRRVSFAPGSNPFSMWKYRSALIDRIVAVAEAVKEVLVAAGVPAEKVEVIRSGVDLERFAPKAPNPSLAGELGMPSGRLVIGKIANASPWKGQTVLLEAAAILSREGRDLHFLFAGRDTDAGWMEAEVSRLGLQGRVSLAGFREDVPELLSLLSVSVNAAVKGEGLSGALRESLAMGVPAVASDTAGNRELFAKDPGPFLFPPGDAKSLAGRIAWVLDHPQEARSAVEAWRARAKEEFSLEATISRTDALYRRLTA